MIIRNFLFHRVSPENDLSWGAVDPLLFDRVIRFLSSKYTIVNAEEIIDNGLIKTGKPLATVSFDDGFRDNYEHAVEILLKHHCPASFYIVTGSIDNDEAIWTYQLDHVFRKTKKNEMVLNTEAVPGLINNLKFGSEVERITFGQKLKNYLKYVPDATRETIYNEVIHYFDDVKPPSVMMSWDNVRDIISNGFVVGSHTSTHRMLNKIENEKVLEDELKLSFEKILVETKIAPSVISWPCGFYNEKVIDFAKNAGYRGGLATGQKKFKYNADELFSIPRIELYNESWFKTRLRMNGWLEQARKLID